MRALLCAKSRNQFQLGLGPGLFFGPTDQTSLPQGRLIRLRFVFAGVKQLGYFVQSLPGWSSRVWSTKIEQRRCLLPSD